MKQYRTFLLVLAVTLMSGVSLSAATSLWDGDTDTLWTTPGNWDTAPAGGEDIVFPNVTGQTVDLGAGSYGIGTLTFNAPDAYSLGNGTLTLGGDFSQNGAGDVTLNAGIDLGGAGRGFGGSGSGVVTLNSPVTGDGFDATLNGGNYVIANNANTINRWVIKTGATAKIVGSGPIPQYNNASYFGGAGGASFGGYFVKLDGGVLDFQATETGDTPSWGTDPKDTATMAADWQDRAIIFGPNGGTLLWTNAAPGGGIGTGSSTRGGPAIYYSQGGPGTIVIGQPLPYNGDPWDGTPASTNRFRSPFEVEYGFALGIFQNSSLVAPLDSNPYLKWRQGSGDLTLILTNGASAYLDWNAMTNGNLIIKGQPGGDSSVIETNATGWTRNVGRFAIRGVHRSGIQFSSTEYPAGTITRSFYMDQPYGIKFYDAVQVWNRNDHGRLACDISIEPGASVDVCGGRRTANYDWGYPGNAAIGQAGPTNRITIESGGKLNLNLQLRSNIGDSRTSPYGESAGLRIFSFVDIKDGGELKIYRSQTNAIGKNASSGGGVATKCIELFRPITGNGSSAADSRLVVDLPWSPKSNGGKDGGGTAGDNGVNFEANPSGMGGSYPGALPIVNGSGDYGLRIVGKGSYVTNYLEAIRGGANTNALGGLTGSGGTLTIALTDTVTIDIRNGPGAASSVKLGLDKEGGNSPTYVLGTDASMANFAGLVLKSGTAAVNDSSTVTMQTLKLGASATIQLGTGAGGSVLNFANSGAVSWNAGTLSITSWNGNLAGGGSDQIKFGTDATGLTAGQLAQIKWIAPNGGADVTGASILANGEIVPYVAPVTEITSPAIVNGEFVFNVVPGLPGQTSIIQCATNLTPPIDWVSVLTNTGAFSFTNATALPESYYRVLVQ